MLIGKILRRKIDVYGPFHIVLKVVFDSTQETVNILDTGSLLHIVHVSIKVFVIYVEMMGRVEFFAHRS